MLTSILITIAVMKVIIAIIFTSSCISISIVAAVILSTIANAEASKTGWLYTLSKCHKAPGPESRGGEP